MTDLVTSREAARLMLSRFTDPALASQRPALIAALRPIAEDYTAVFHADVAAAARAAYDQGLWAHPVVWPLHDDQIYLRVGCALSEELGLPDNLHARDFPGGYKDIAAHLVPGRLWFAWEFSATAAGSGLAFDGLVELGPRWAWFPKPWRVLPRTGK